VDLLEQASKWEMIRKALYTLPVLKRRVQVIAGQKQMISEVGQTALPSSDLPSFTCSKQVSIGANLDKEVKSGDGRRNYERRKDCGE
jgi:hypothetical protein